MSPKPLKPGSDGEGRKGKERFKSITAPRKCLLEMFTEPGLPTRVGPKRTPSKTSVPYPDTPEVSALPHCKHIVLPTSHLLPVPPRYAPGGLESRRPHVQDLELPRPMTCHTVSLSRHLKHPWQQQGVQHELKCSQSQANGARHSRISLFHLTGHLAA